MLPWKISICNPEYKCPQSGIRIYTSQRTKGGRPSNSYAARKKEENHRLKKKTGSDHTTGLKYCCVPAKGVCENMWTGLNSWTCLLNIFKSNRVKITLNKNKENFIINKIFSKMFKFDNKTVQKNGNEGYFSLQPNAYFPYNLERRPMTWLSDYVISMLLCTYHWALHFIILLNSCYLVSRAGYQQSFNSEKPRIA